MSKTTVAYIPHGINSKSFRPINKQDKDYEEFITFKEKFYKEYDCNFIVFWNNRNIRRKQSADVILSYRRFCDKLPTHMANKCLLLMHTAPIDENGTDLFAVINAVCPNYKIKFSDGYIDSKMLNFLYNLADCTINIASNEGFGLSSAESIMAGTPVVNNVTGGLQDQMRFEDENKDWINFSNMFTTNHTGKYKNCGVWAYPVFPSNRSLQGSVVTPYIFDDRCSFEDVAYGIYYWWNMDPIDRKDAGLKGREWFLSVESGMSSTEMCKRFANAIDHTLQNFERKNSFELIKVLDEKPITDELLGIVWE